MQSTAYVALSHQAALSRQIDILANNMANASTPAFKAEQPVFHEFLTKGPNGQTVSYVQDAGVVRDTRQGDLTTTGNPLDFAISGAGYFTVDTPDGQRYTRNGRFQIGANGQLQTADGYNVLSDQGQPISIPSGSGTISVGEDGTISTATGQVGKIGVAHFDNPQALVSQAGNLYVTDITPTPDTTSQIHQGSIEGSNVQAVAQMTRLLDVQHAYASAQNMIDSEDTRIKSAIDKLSQAV